MKLQRPRIITSIHNPMAYELSNEVGHYASRTRLIEVIWNTLGRATRRPSFFDLLSDGTS